MGRMSEARRRARQKAAPATPPAPDAPPPEAPAEAAAPHESEAAAQTPPAAGEPETVAKGPAEAAPGPAAGAQPGGEPEHALVFPAEEAIATARLVLPASGLAEDVLATAEAALVATGTAGVAASVPAAAPASAAAARAHQFTFFAAPEREAREQVEPTEHLVTFLVASEEYGVDVRLVQEIIRVPAVTAVPRAPAFVRGVINLRGRIIPVVDLKTKLGLGRVDESQRHARILVVRLKGRLLGLVVDGASQVLKVPLSVIEAAPEEVVEIESAFIRGVAKLDSRLIILIDLVEVLAPELRAAGAVT